MASGIRLFLLLYSTTLPEAKGSAAYVPTFDITASVNKSPPRSTCYCNSIVGWVLAITESSELNVFDVRECIYKTSEVPGCHIGKASLRIIFSVSIREPSFHEQSAPNERRAWVANKFADFKRSLRLSSFFSSPEIFIIFSARTETLEKEVAAIKFGPPPSSSSQAINFTSDERTTISHLLRTPDLGWEDNFLPLDRP